MAGVPFLNHIDLNQNELQNAVLQNLTTDPTGPKAGQIYYKSDTFIWYWNGTAWTKLATGTVPNATTSIAGLVQLSGDLGNIHTAPTVLTVGGATAANIADAVAKRHAQNTDLGTSATTFYIGTGGPLLKSASGAISLRNTGDTANADLTVANLSCANLTVSGTAPFTRKYTALIGNGTLTAIPVTHNLGTQDAAVSLRRVSDQRLVQADVVFTSTTVLTINFTTAPAANALSVTVVG
jgi:hypothetical protein